MDPTRHSWVETPNRRRTAHEFVQEALRRAILSGELSAGSHLVQSDLAAQLDVSTTPVREALRNLTTEGLVVFDALRGAMVRQLSSQELKEICEIRLALEPLSISRAIERIDEETMARAEAIHERMVTLDDFGEWLELNREFHSTHHEAADSPRLQVILVGLQNASAMYVGRAARIQPELRTQGERDHAEICQAFRDRDEEAAVAVMMRHVRMPLDLMPEDAFAGTG